MNDYNSIIKKYSLYIILGILILIFSIFTERFFTWLNIINILKRISITGIISLGTMVVIISGGIDVSVGAVAALSSVLSALYLTHFNSVAVLIVILSLTALIIGLLIGTVISKGNVPPIIATLALLSIIRGSLMIFTGGFTIDDVHHPLMRFLSRGKFLTVPNMVWVMIIAYLVTAVILNKTKFGRYVYAIGGNEEISRLSGLPVKKVKVFVYVYASFMSMLAGVVLFSRLGVGQPTAVVGIELDCIASVVLGGASLSGGKGKVINTFLGVLILGLLINGMNYLNVVTYWQYVVQGIVILLATLIYSKRK